jgi:hypothetical protein
MPQDFTLDQFKAICLALQEAGYQTMTVAQYMVDVSKSAHVVVLRHDVDRFPGHALRMARMEQHAGICSTYYFRTNPGVFRPNILSDIAHMGHEVGYHYETLAQSNGDYPAALDLFEKELARLRQVCPIQTISMHGSPLSAYDNRDLWKRYDFRQFGLAGEAYLSIDYHHLVYLTDAGRSWADNLNNLRDRVSGETPPAAPTGVRSSADLINAIREKRFDQICISAHPERWASNTPEWLLSAGLDMAANSIKTAMRLLNLRGSPGAGRGRAQ